MQCPVSKLQKPSNILCEVGAVVAQLSPEDKKAFFDIWCEKHKSDAVRVHQTDNPFYVFVEVGAFSFWADFDMSLRNRLECSFIKLSFQLFDKA